MTKPRIRGVQQLNPELFKVRLENLGKTLRADANRAAPGIRSDRVSIRGLAQPNPRAGTTFVIEAASGSFVESLDHRRADL